MACLAPGFLAADLSPQEALALLLGDQSVTGFLEPRPVVGRSIGGYAPSKRLVLSVALAKPPGDLGARQFGAEIEGVGSVLVDAELGKQCENILRHVMPIAIKDMDAVLGDLDAEILVAHLLCGLLDLLRRQGKWPARMQAEEVVGIALGQFGVGAGSKHHAPGDIVLFVGAPGMGADLHHEHVPDAELRGDAEKHGGGPCGVGVGQLGEIAGAEKDLALRPCAPEVRVTLERGHEAEIDRIEDGVGEIGAALFVERVHGAIERGHVAMILGDQHRRRGHLIGDMQRLLVEAEQIVGARLASAQQLVRVRGIDARRVAVLLECANRLLEMGKGRVGQAAEIDHIGALVRIILGPLQDLLDGHGRGVDDLGENLDVVFGHVRRLARAAEIDGNVLDLVRAAQHRHAIVRAQAIEVGAAAAGQHDLVGLDRLRQPPQDDLFGHQRRNLHPDVEHLPVEAGLHAFEHGL